MDRWIDIYRWINIFTGLMVTAALGSSMISSPRLGGGVASSADDLRPESVALAPAKENRIRLGWVGTSFFSLSLPLALSLSLSLYITCKRVIIRLRRFFRSLALSIGLRPEQRVALAPKKTHTLATSPHPPLPLSLSLCIDVYIYIL